MLAQLETLRNLKKGKKENKKRKFWIIQKIEGKFWTSGQSRTFTDLLQRPRTSITYSLRNCGVLSIICKRKTCGNTCHRILLLCCSASGIKGRKLWFSTIWRETSRKHMKQHNVVERDTRQQRQRLFCRVNAITLFTYHIIVHSQNLLGIFETSLRWKMLVSVIVTKWHNERKFSRYCL